MEIELKLRIDGGTLQRREALAADPLLAPQQAPGKTPSHRKTRARLKQLDNIYFDTADRQLEQARIGLRLRKDGRRWLQTVKSGGSAQGGLHQREEIEFVVTGRALELQRLAGTAFADVLAPLTEQLRPAFRTTFTRDTRLLRGATGAIIEAAIDAGDIIAGGPRDVLRLPLCELELELKSGAVDDLFALALQLAERHPLVLDNRSKAERGSALARLHDSGTHASLAAPCKAGDVSLPRGADSAGLAHAAVANCVAHWQANEAGFLAQAVGKVATIDAYDSEYLHQVRVAVRRLRVAAGPLARAAGWHADALHSIKGNLQRLGQQLGGARDWDVFLLETWPLVADQIDNAALRSELLEVMASARSAAHVQAQAALSSRGAQRALLTLHRCLAGPQSAAGIATAPAIATLDEAASPNGSHQLLDLLYADLHRGLLRIDKLKAEELHRLRITAKKMRYLTEFAASLYDASASASWLKWLKHAQETLGARNDRSVAKSRLRELATHVDARHGKVRRLLAQAIDAVPLPDVHLPPPPKPYWH